MKKPRSKIPSHLKLKKKKSNKNNEEQSHIKTKNNEELN
jgi:hypothetical protein